MNKILNWTFGACFRTLGRFLAIFIVGVFLIFIGSKIGLELPDWLALSVNASTTPGWASTLPSPQNIAYYSCNGATTCSQESNNIDYFESQQTLRPFVYNPNYWIIGQNGYVVGSPITTMKKGYLYSADFYVCVNKAFDSNFDIYSSLFENFSNTNTYSVTRRTLISNEPVIDGGRSFAYCQVYSALLVPEEDHNWVYFRLTRKNSNVTDFVLSTIAVDTREIGIYSDTIKNIIDNSGYATAESVEQVQQSVSKVQEELEQTQDTITNEDTTGAEDSASGFFNDFTTETFGLTAIITSPLNAINSLISSTCSPLVVPLPYVNQNLSLPCMSNIYNDFFGAFFSIYQLITTGLISYYVIVRIFNLVKDFKNPDHDEIEVVDL